MHIHAILLILTAHFPHKPGLACCPLPNSQSPVILEMSIIKRQAKTPQILSDTTQLGLLWDPPLVDIHC